MWKRRNFRSFKRVVYMKKRILLLGYSGKIGFAIKNVFEESYEIVGFNSRDFDAEKIDSIENIIVSNPADIIINAVAFLGIDPCDAEPEKAFKINTLFPKRLAEISKKNWSL